MSKRLNIIETESSLQPSAPRPSTINKKRRDETKIKFDKIWLEKPGKFNTEKNCIERERIRRTLNLMLKSFNPKHKKVIDLGCGSGKLAIHLSSLGAHVHCIDISNVALSYLEEKKYERITTAEDYVPRTLQQDENYDVVVSTELIGYLHQDDYRLYFSELSRLLKPHGVAVCSTSIDFNSEDALQNFANLAETEFQIDKWVFSYHAYYIKFINLINSPHNFVKASKNYDHKQFELSKRPSSLKSLWFKINSSIGPALLWSYVRDKIYPYVKKAEQSKVLLILTEKVCKNFANDSGISHAIFIGSPRPLVQETATIDLPKEKKERKTVWE